MTVKDWLAKGVLIICFAAIGWSATHAILIRADAEPVSVAPTNIDVGQVLEGTKLKREAWLFNNSAKPVEISGIVPSCGCTTASVGPQTLIGPGQRLPLQIGFDSYGRPGPIEKFVTVYFRKPDFALRIRLTGNVRKQVSIVPEYLDLHTVPLGHIVDGAVVLTRLDGGKLIVSNIHAEPNIATTKQVLSASCTKINVAVRGDQQPGGQNASLDFECNLPDEPSISIPLYYTVQGEITSEPPRMNFGLVRPGTPGLSTVVLSGKLAGSASIVWCPPGVTADINRKGPDKAILHGQCLYKTASNQVLDSYIRLRTTNPQQTTVFVPVFGAAQ